jgi:hypothetical protein
LHEAQASALVALDAMASAANNATTQDLYRALIVSLTFN